MDMSIFVDYCRENMKAHPDLKNDIVELYMLCKSEIEEGGSEMHEIELAVSDIEKLIENKERTKK